VAARVIRRLGGSEPGARAARRSGAVGGASGVGSDLPSVSIPAEQQAARV